MKRPLKWIGLAAIVALCSIAYLYVFSSDDDPGSFRGVKWGSSIQGLPGMVPFAEDGDLTFFQRKDDRLKIGDVPIEKLIYGFYKGRFYSVMMYYDSQESFSRAKEVLSREHGAPYQASESDNRFYWEKGDVILVLTYDAASAKGRIIYTFQPIENEMDEGRAQGGKGPS